MGIKGFRYNRNINVPRVWQDYIYAYSRMYYCNSSYAAVIDSAIIIVASDYFTELKRVVVDGESTRKVGIDYAVSERTLQRKVKRYYEQVYRMLK